MLWSPLCSLPTVGACFRNTAIQFVLSSVERGENLCRLLFGSASERVDKPSCLTPTCFKNCLGVKVSAKGSKYAFNANRLGCWNIVILLPLHIVTNALVTPHLSEYVSRDVKEIGGSVRQD